MYTIYQEWKDQLENVTDFIIYNNRLPCINIDKNYAEFKKLGYWCINQQNNYNSDINLCKKIMKEPEIKYLWEDFIDMYPDLFSCPIEDWNRNLDDTIDFIIHNNRFPSIIMDKDDYLIEQLGYWIIDQMVNYDIDINLCKKLMKEPEIKCLWEDFMNMYPDLFYTPIEDWNRNLNDTIDFIIYNNRLPSIIDNKDNYKIEQLGYWVINQMMNYNSDIKKCKKRMKEPKIKYLWEELMDMYPYLFTNSMSY